jgi:hypothetical protein
VGRTKNKSGQTRNGTIWTSTVKTRNPCRVHRAITRPPARRISLTNHFRTVMHAAYNHFRPSPEACTAEVIPGIEGRDGEPAEIGAGPGRLTARVLPCFITRRAIIAPLRDSYITFGTERRHGTNALCVLVGVLLSGFLDDRSAFAGQEPAVIGGDKAVRFEQARVLSLCRFVQDSHGIHAQIPAPTSRLRLPNRRSAGT